MIEDQTRLDQPGDELDFKIGEVQIDLNKIFMVKRGETIQYGQFEFDLYQAYDLLNQSSLITEGVITNDELISILNVMQYSRIDEQQLQGRTEEDLAALLLEKALENARNVTQKIELPNSNFIKQRFQKILAKAISRSK